MIRRFNVTERDMAVIAPNDALLQDWSYSGHGTEALGPSDSSDSGSDVQGGSQGDDNAFPPRGTNTNASADDTVINAAPHWRPSV
jgi:hypothetical protein